MARMTRDQIRARSGVSSLSLATAETRTRGVGHSSADDSDLDCLAYQPILKTMAWRQNAERRVRRLRFWPTQGRPAQLAGPGRRPGPANWAGRPAWPGAAQPTGPAGGPVWGVGEGGDFLSQLLVALLPGHGNKGTWGLKIFQMTQTGAKCATIHLAYDFACISHLESPGGRCAGCFAVCW